MSRAFSCPEKPPPRPNYLARQRRRRRGRRARRRPPRGPRVAVHGPGPEDGWAPRQWTDRGCVEERRGEGSGEHGRAGRGAWSWEGWGWWACSGSVDSLWTVVVLVREAERTGRSREGHVRVVRRAAGLQRSGGMRIGCVPLRFWLAPSPASQANSNCTTPSYPSAFKRIKQVFQRAATNEPLFVFCPLSIHSRFNFRPSLQPNRHTQKRVTRALVLP